MFHINQERESKNLQVLQKKNKIKLYKNYFKIKVTARWLKMKAENNK